MFVWSDNGVLLHPIKHHLNISYVVFERRYHTAFENTVSGGIDGSHHQMIEQGLVCW
jgi:hypothetical protein